MWPKRTASSQSSPREKTVFFLRIIHLYININLRVVGTILLVEGNLFVFLGGTVGHHTTTPDTLYAATTTIYISFPSKAVVNSESNTRNDKGIHNREIL
jgi:hypothetical protein